LVKTILSSFLISSDSRSVATALEKSVAMSGRHFTLSGYFDKPAKRCRVWRRFARRLPALNRAWEQIKHVPELPPSLGPSGSANRR
jgi:hypothetical protein